MHYLHCILVKINEGDTKEEIRKYAERETDCFYEDVYDWRETDTPGRWADEYPSVILGSEERFLKELNYFKEKPLEAALNYVRMCNFKDVRWRTNDEIKEGKFKKINKSSFLGPNEGEEEKFYSGYPKKPITITEKKIKELWEGEFDWDAYLVSMAIRLVTGEYKSDSSFYSTPDSSSKMSEKTKEDIDKNPEEYALVFFDYHN